MMHYVRVIASNSVKWSKHEVEMYSQGDDSSIKKKKKGKLHPLFSVSSECHFVFLASSKSCFSFTEEATWQLYCFTDTEFMTECWLNE